ncbi:MAG: SDR family oxidoreductase [Planctomycetota bacterium]|nr:SDR family oxidoreductase [Planctomycetota bacterium]
MMGSPAVVLVTGASSGIGKACAEHLSQLGHRVYGTSRNREVRVSGYEMLRMDVTQERSVSGGIDRILEIEGKLDALVNSSGISMAGAVEDTSIEEAKLQFETNFFGTVRVCKAALPTMRQRQAGTIVNISSVAGIIALPFQALYSASKFALEGFSEALRIEVAPFGIRVVLVQPGDFSTNLTANRVRARASRSNPAYRERFERTLEIMERAEREGPDPACVAILVGKLIRRQAPSLRNPVGMFSQRMAVAAKRVLPAGCFEWLLRKKYEL